MYYSITFSEDLTLYENDPNADGPQPKVGQLKGINTWDDWHLIPTSRPSVAPPAVSTNFVEIPGLNGAIDMSDYLCGRPVYGNRSGSWDFYVDNDHENWETIRMKISNYLHGRKFKISFESDPRFYWEGRFSVGEWKSEATNSRISINYTLSPFKTALADVPADPDLIWNTFNFERDADWNEYEVQGEIDTEWRALVTELLGGVSVSPGNTVIKDLPDSKYFKYFMSVSVTLQNGVGEVNVDIDGRRETLTHDSATAVLYSDKLIGGKIKLTGSGTVVFGFRERSL